MCILTLPNYGTGGTTKTYGCVHVLYFARALFARSASRRGARGCFVPASAPENTGGQAISAASTRCSLHCQACRCLRVANCTRRLRNKQGTTGRRLEVL